MNVEEVKIELKMKLDMDTGEVYSIEQILSGIEPGLFLAWSVLGKNLIATRIMDFREHPERYYENTTERMIIDDLRMKMASTILTVDEEIVNETIDGEDGVRITRIATDKDKNNLFDKYDK